MDSKEIPTNLNKIYRTVDIKIKEMERPKRKMKDIFVGVKEKSKKKPRKK